RRAASGFQKGTNENETSIWHGSRRTIVEGNCNRTAVFQGCCHLCVNDWTSSFRIGVHLPGGKRVEFNAPDPGHEKEREHNCKSRRRKKVTRAIKTANRQDRW